MAGGGEDDRLPANEEITMTRVGLFALNVAAALCVALSAAPVSAQQAPTGEAQNRYQLERLDESIVRLDRQTGAVSLCRDEAGSLVCRLAADERTAFEQEIDMLAKRVDALEKKLGMPAAGHRLPSEAEVEQTLTIMERFMRRFMDIIGERQTGTEPAPDRT
jgi:cytochrome P450